MASSAEAAASAGKPGLSDADNVGWPTGMAGPSPEGARAGCSNKSRHGLGPAARSVGVSSRTTKGSWREESITLGSQLA
jgi:hypothetical protein